MRRRLRFPALALAAVGLALAVLPSAAGAAEPSATGWWSRTATPLPLNPTAPTAQEGQLVVQGEPSGANAIAALRWTLAEGETSPTLTITAAEGSVMPAEALILACKAGSPWEETHNGAWADAPKVDCGTSVNGVVTDDGSITFALGALLDGTNLDIVLTPGKTPEDQGSAFSLIFDRPGADALMTSSGGDAGGGFDPSTAGSDFSSDTAGSGSFSAPSTDAGSSFSAPSTDAGAVSPAAEPALPEENQVAMGSDQGGQAGLQQAAATGDDRDRVRTLGIAVLLAGAAVAAWSFMAGNGAAQQVAAAGTPVAPVAANPTPGGLGRFVRPRTGAPPSLS